MKVNISSSMHDSSIHSPLSPISEGSGHCDSGGGMGEGKAEKGGEDVKNFPDRQRKITAAVSPSPTKKAAAAMVNMSMPGGSFDWGFDGEGGDGGGKGQVKGGKGEDGKDKAED